MYTVIGPRGDTIISYEKEKKKGIEILPYKFLTVRELSITFRATFSTIFKRQRERFTR